MGIKKKTPSIIEGVWTLYFFSGARGVEPAADEPSSEAGGRRTLPRLIPSVRKAAGPRPSLATEKKHLRAPKTVWPTIEARPAANECSLS